MRQQVFQGLELGVEILEARESVDKVVGQVGHDVFHTMWSFCIMLFLYCTLYITKSSLPLPKLIRYDNV